MTIVVLRDRRHCKTCDERGMVSLVLLLYMRGFTARFTSTGSDSGTFRESDKHTFLNTPLPPVDYYLVLLSIMSMSASCRWISLGRLCRFNFSGLLDLPYSIPK